MPLLLIGAATLAVSWLFTTKIVDLTLFTIVGGLTALLGNLVGSIVGVFTMILFAIAPYSNFINEPIVIKGWVMVRDVCNMFFILILLVIAFATILRIESYNIKKTLPKLLIMAVLINFSKTICGLAIDFAQVIMLTFVNGLGQAGAGNLYTAFGIDKLYSMKVIADVATGGAQNTLGFQVTGSLLFALIFMVIFLIIVVVYTIILVIRIIMLWIYIILSPIAFIGSAFPAGQKYSQQWVSEFTKYVIIGPVMAFFLWLALSTATANLNISSISLNQSSGQTGIDKTGLYTLGTGSEGSTPIAVGQFVVSACLLIGALMVAQQIGGIAGSVAGKGMAVLQKGKGISKLGRAGLNAGVTKVGRELDKAQLWAQKKTLGKLSADYIPKSMNYRHIKDAWKANKETNLAKYDTDTRGKEGWRDTFNKYNEIGQYMAVRKGAKRRFREGTEDARLNAMNNNSLQRIEWSKKSSNDKNEIRGKLDSEKIKADYKSKGLDAEKEYAEDLASLSNSLGNNKYGDKFREEQGEKIKKNREEMEKIGYGDNVLFGYKNAKQNITSFYKSGGDEHNAKTEKELDSRTGGQDFMVVKELIQALNQRDESKILGAFQILAKNNDLNEALKDNRIIGLMTKEGGILEDIARSMKLSATETDQLKDNFRSNPVTPGNVQAMIQGFFKKAGTDNNLAAKYAHEIGSTSFASGNGVAYGMAPGDEISGNYKFDDMKFKDGQLVASEGRMMAIIGKFANMESQAKMRGLHPDTFIKEGPSGQATGLSEEGKAFVKSLTAHDLGQVSRMRLDVIRKIGDSKQSLADLKAIVDELNKAGQTSRADLVKFFTGYIKSKYDGKGLDEEKPYKTAMKTWDEESNKW